jgi:spore maturation protein CgeB
VKIVIVGSDKIFAIENGYVKYLREQGVQVICFPAQTLFSDYYRKNAVNKILFRIGVSGVYDQINSALKRIISAERPDVVWIFKGMEIFPQTLAWIKNQNIRIANYNPDNPFLFSGRGSGNSNMTRSVPLYDLHFTYNLEIKRQLVDRFEAKTAWLPFGFDVDDLLYSECEKQEEIREVCFLGNPDRERSVFVKSLAERQIPVTVYGLHWNKYVRHPWVRNAGPVYGDELWKTLRRYRVQLNLMRPHNLNSHNMRSFEVPGVGGIMLAPDTPEHRSFFEHGKEAFFFGDVGDCAAQIDNLLSLSPSGAEQIRCAARARSLGSGYSYRDRAKSALKELEQLH